MTGLHEGNHGARVRTDTAEGSRDRDARRVRQPDVNGVQRQQVVLVIPIANIDEPLVQGREAIDPANVETRIRVEQPVVARRRTRRRHTGDSANHRDHAQEPRCSDRLPDHRGTLPFCSRRCDGRRIERKYEGPATLAFILAKETARGFIPSWSAAISILPAWLAGLAARENTGWLVVARMCCRGGCMNTNAGHRARLPSPNLWTILPPVTGPPAATEIALANVARSRGSATGATMDRARRER